MDQAVQIDPRLRTKAVEQVHDILGGHISRGALRIRAAAQTATELSNIGTPNSYEA